MKNGNYCDVLLPEEAKKKVKINCPLNNCRQGNYCPACV